MAERPTRSDLAVIEVAVQKLAADCAEWSQGETDADEWLDDLRNALSWHRDNGYELAKYLDDRAGVSPDAELVEILDNAWHYISNAYDEALAAWVDEVGFTPLLAPGDRVSTPRGVGTVHSIDKKRASYCVTVDSQKGGGYIGTYFTPAEVVALLTGAGQEVGGA